MLEYEGAEPLSRATDPLRLTVSLSHKIGLPDYSSAEGFMSIGGITVDHSDADIAALVERGRVAYGLMGAQVTAKAVEAKRKLGWS